MKDTIAIFAVAFSCGITFSLGQDTWRWFSARYLKFFHPPQTLTIAVDNKQALDAIAQVQAGIEKVKDTASQVRGAA